MTGVQTCALPISCVVYGMPKAVIDANLANLILDADDIAAAITATVRG